MTRNDPKSPFVVVGANARKRLPAQPVDARGTLCSSTTSAQPRVFPVRKAINQRVGSGNGTAVVCLMRSIANRDVTSASVIPSTSRL